MQEESSSITRKLLTPDGILITAVTWNLFGSLPPANSLFSLANSTYFDPKPHLIFFATQQCEKDLWMTLCCEGKSAWQDMIRQSFPEYQLKSSQVMRGMHSACLVLKKHKDQAQVYRVNRLKTGACGCMGTKGALSTVIIFMGELIQFINCHLTSGHNQSSQRNHTIESILQHIVQKELRCDIIFGGDFNYRIDISYVQYLEMLVEKQRNTQLIVKYKSFLHQDQLKKQKELKDNFLKNYEEGTIDFPPTYKLSTQGQQYSKRRVPGWTDRIFHRISPSLQRLSYGCEYEARGCDHRPVLAQFKKILSGPVFHLSKDGQGGACQLI